MEEAEDADEEEDLEEGEKDVGLGGVEQAESQQGGDATVEDGWTDLRHCHDHPLVPDDDDDGGYDDSMIDLYYHSLVIVIAVVIVNVIVILILIVIAIAIAFAIVIVIK